MKQPQPDFSGETKILFVTEGNSIAMLSNRPEPSPMEFRSPAAALAWCRKRGVMMLYTPRDPSAN
jgi:hypothetical protein